MRLAAAALALALALALGACSTAPAPPRAAPTVPKPSAPATAMLSERVVELARSLLATPYRYAGDDPRGFDCSGLTAYVFDRFGVALPRTAESQARSGRWVAPDELAPGDLVFFGATRDKPHHVGLVVSEPGAELAMIHASSSRGVVETRVTESAYWLERLRFGRRVLPR